MRFRHATTLALLGWYLMMPPPKEYTKGPPTPDYGEPLAEWSVGDTFDTAQECKDELKRRIQRAEELDAASKRLADESPELRSDRHFAGNEMLWAFSFQCIATDDPRLKSKKK
jgi:hypothetical protein